MVPARILSVAEVGLSDPAGFPLIRPRIMLFVGTRPEAIKMAPVVRALRESSAFDTRVVFTGQHEALADDAARAVGLTADVHLHLDRRSASLTELTAKLLLAADRAIDEFKPGLVLAQGDTTTVLSACLAAFYAGVAVGHVEAGLRTGNLCAPFPEEANRQMVARLADIHFAPTTEACENLLAEGIPRAKVVVTGNTSIDMLRIILSTRGQDDAAPPCPDPYILLTMHRREAWAEGLGRVCHTVREIASRRPGLTILFPVHPGPRVHDEVFAHLSGVPNVRLIDPLPYGSFIRAAYGARVILTDSGGVQEEGCAMHKPVLVLREETERSEGVSSGCEMIVGTQPQVIARAVDMLLDDPAAYDRFARARNPFGDGRAAQRIVRSIEKWFACGEPALAREDEFLPGAPELTEERQL